MYEIVQVLDVDVTTLEVDAITRETSSLPPGRTDVVKGGSLPCRWVISVGRSNSVEDVAAATAAVLARAEKLGAGSLALVPLGAADRRMPLAELARAEVGAVMAHAAGDSRLERIVYAVRGEEQADAFALGNVEAPDPLDPANVPEALHPLLPLAERWGIGDDPGREALVETASDDELRELVTGVERLREPLGDWLGEFADAAPPPEYFTLSCLFYAFESAELELSRRT